ncbi:hypothetical protein NW762_007537 [Fusarium torreyae]|uniref:Uncharacterized protein n=1 Tax=Fusarium torreyae TaxID=1237075 RepID=A0A9W8VCW5_9HYPO|nr:hypothetical protein NW762_007537 [Fusarium torreyae]
MSYHSDPFAGQSDPSLPVIAQENFSTQHPGPLVSNPPFGPPTFQPQPGPPRGPDSGYNSESASQVNFDSNSWVPSAHQAITNALQASGYANGPVDMAAMGMLPGQYAEPDYGSVEPPTVPPNTPIQGVSRLVAPAMPYGADASAP